MEANENRYIYRPEFGNEADIARLINQYNALVPEMKLFHPVYEPEGNETVLDLGCGPGSWGLDVAFAYQEMSVIGLDIDESAVLYAMARARSSGYENVTFEVHDVTTPLPINDASVDYINISFANSFLLKEQWPRLFAECYRVLRPGGWLRSIEALAIQTSSRAGRELWRLHGMANEKDGRRYAELAPHLLPMLHDARLVATPLTIHFVDFSEQAPYHKSLAENWYVSANLVMPFIVKQGVAPKEEVQRLIEEMQRDMMLPQFYALIFFTDIAAQKPAD